MSTQATLIHPVGNVFAYAPKFPKSELLSVVRDFLPALPPWDGSEGPRARFSFSPGTVSVSRRDLARRERAGERALRMHGATVSYLAGELRDYCPEHGAPAQPGGPLLDPWCPQCGASLQPGGFRPDPASRQEITQWSRKSRANMCKALCEIDYTSMLTRGHTPAMVTLTYPGDWLTVAPNGAAAKRHLAMFVRAYRRAWGTKLVGIWKFELQRRGAPHFHIMMVPPHGKARVGYGAGLAFKVWLSAVWARIVNHPDPEQRRKHRAAGTRIDFREGLKAKDPKRVAVYFLKHGAFKAKEYQNCVPAAWREPGQGPGRFWGYWGLDRTVYAVEIDPDDAIAVARLIRRWARAQGTTHAVDVWRTPGGQLRPTRHDVIGLAGAQELGAQPRARRRSSRRRVKRLQSGAGWVSVNDGAAFASQIADYLKLRGRPVDAAADKARRLRAAADQRRELLARLARYLSSLDRPPP